MTAMFYSLMRNAADTKGAANMSKSLEIRIGSTIYGRINAARMSEAERQVAINAMRDADLLVDAFVWISKKIERLAERLFLNHSLKH